MTESEEQRFFNALNSTGRAEDYRDTAGPRADSHSVDGQCLTTPAPRAGFADDDPQGGRHHVSSDMDNALLVTPAAGGAQTSNRQRLGAPTERGGTQQPSGPTAENRNTARREPSPKPPIVSTPGSRGSSAQPSTPSAGDSQYSEVAGHNPAPRDTRDAALPDGVARGLEPAASSGRTALAASGFGDRPHWVAKGSPGAGGVELRSEQISSAELVAPPKVRSSRGWRKWLHLGESPDEQKLRNLNATVNTNLRGVYSIVVMGGKGGVGKTTTTAAVGSTFALLRKDRTVAIDANPDRASNLADRIDPAATNSFDDVLADPNLQRYSDIRSHVGQNPAGLDVLGNRYQSNRQPLSTQTYVGTHDRLQRFYSVLISDSGTDVDHPVIEGLMSRADALIIVAATAADGAKGAAEMMDWAYEAGYHRLLQRSVVVINGVHSKVHRKLVAALVDKLYYRWKGPAYLRGVHGKANRKLVASLHDKFSRWLSPERVFVVPFDAHIASAGPIDIEKLSPLARRRFLEITAQVATGFNSSEEQR